MPSEKFFFFQEGQFVYAVYSESHNLKDLDLLLLFIDWLITLI